MEAQKFLERWRELAVRAKQQPGGRGIEHWPATDGHQVTSNPQSRIATGQTGSFFESRGVGHKGCTGDNALLVGLNDSAVHSGSETKIVCVDNESHSRWYR